MRTKTLLMVIAAAASLSACGNTGTSIDLENTNPLVATRYGDELADTLANIVIQNDPISKEPGMRQIIEQEIARAKSIAMRGRQEAKNGAQGAIIAEKESVTGYALLMADVLWLSSDFETSPGPDLHVYLTTIVDPRGETFPDQTAMDLGVIRSVYGAQEYALPSRVDPAKMRTLVLFDTKLNRIYGFAQLSR
ncbi:MAG: DM13 domain-containing protein [Candidatus Peribacteraceae bacterium]|nr:DM13 domain-containing protein [Candidatus Peribacteraceae bacterium]